MDRSTLKSRMVSSSFWSAVSAGGNQVASFVIFIVVARLITREEFGLVALASVLIDFGQILSAGGIPDAVIQRRELDEDAADTAFWINLAAGLALMAAVFAVSHGAAGLFATPGLTHVLDLLALTFAITPLGTIHTARLARAFGFKALAIRNLVSTVLGGGVGIGMALGGWGVDALCAQRIVFALCITALSWRATGWVPRRRFSAAAARSLGSYGVRMVGSQLLGQVNARLPELLAGFLLGPVAVAVVRIASRCSDVLAQLTIGPFQQTALPVLSRAQGDPATARAAYADFSRLSAFVIFPAFAGASVLAPIGVGAVFGAQWADAGPVAQVLLTVAVAMHFNILLPATLAAAGRPGQVLGWSAAQLALGVALTWAGSQWGVVGLVAATVLRAYALLPLGLALLQRRAGIGWRVAVGCVAGPLACALGMAAATLAARLALAPLLPVWAVLAACVAVGAASYAGLSLLINPGVVRELAALRPGRRIASGNPARASL